MCLFLFFRNAKKSKFPQAKGGQCKITDWQTQERAVGAEVYERQNNSTTELTVEVKMQSQLRLRLRTQRNNGPLKHNETGKREDNKTTFETVSTLELASPVELRLLASYSRFG